jgi:hypothetical protein
MATMLTGNVNSANGATPGRHWPYLAVIAALAVALVAALACIAIGETKLRQQLAQIRSASSNTSAAMEAQLDAQGSALTSIEGLQQQQAKAESRETKAIQAEFAAQNKSLDAITIALKQQTSVTYAALGKVIPVKMPREFDAQLSSAERAATRLAKREHPDLAEVKHAIGAVAALALRLPPWAEQDYLPRLNALRWALATEYLLAMPHRQGNQTAAQVIDTAQDLIKQMDSMPNPAKHGIAATTLGTLANYLREEARDLQARGNVLIYESAKANALACLAGTKNNPSLALEGLQPWLKTKRWGREATVLANKIRLLVADRHAKEITQELGRADPRLVGSLAAVATSGAYDQLAGIKISLVSRGLEPDPLFESYLARCKAKLRRIAAQQAVKQAAISRAYQAWAMKQIVACRSEFRAASASAKKDPRNNHIWVKYRPGAWPWYNRQYKQILHAAAKYLLPIRRGDLTAAVQHAYSDEFNAIWEKLAGREDQTQLAEDEAVVRQLSPMDVWNKEHVK